VEDDHVSNSADDRREFELQKRANALAMAKDEGLAKLAVEVFERSDRYDFSYQWSWLGVPIIQLPNDVVATQELIWEHRPQVIIETGIARGGSVLFYSSLLEIIGEGRVIAVDIDIRSHNRAVIEAHPMAHRVTMIEGSSTDSTVVDTVRALLEPGDRVMVVLDSNHTHDHVLAELEAYAPLVTPGQFLIVADTVIEEIPPQDHRPRDWGPGDNPKTAVDAFLAVHRDFELDPYVNAKLLMTSSRGGYLRKRTT
jgi:cephalosporin hydroxylase